MKEIRLKYTFAVLVITTGIIGWVYPQQLGVLLNKLNALALGAVAGYLLDRGIFPYARPGEAEKDDAWMMRRAIIVAASILGVALAL